MNKIKASLTACLFLLPILLPAQDWEMTPSTAQEYERVLDLRYTEDHSTTTAYSPAKLYIHALSEALVLLLTEDLNLFKKFEARADDRIELLEKDQQAASLFVMAEIRLQWSFIHLKFGEELDAAWDLRQAYQLTKLCKKKYPEFKPINKTSGILNVMVGSVPEKYDWILSLLGMEGDITRGIAELTQVQESNSIFSKEARLLKSLVEGYVFQKPKEGIQHIEPLLSANSTPSLVLILATSLSIKNAQSEDALTYINALEEKQLPINLAFIQYLKGEVNLHKGQYKSAIAAYQRFINEYTGQNHLKDAYYKTGIAYWLDNDQERATYYLSTASTVGKEETEADKYAARSLQSNELPNRKLTKLRYFTDGGYYVDASNVMETISIDELKSEKDRVEFYYRKARLYHKTNRSNTAMEFYKKTIHESNSFQTYFAPNACLQLGYLYEEKMDVKNAELYYKKALTYKRHEYKNSIDTKARSALAQLNDRR